MGEEKEEQYTNGTGLNFIEAIGEHLILSPTELKKLMLRVLIERPYILNWEEITDQYHQYLETYGKVDIDEFAFNYVLGYSLINGFSLDNIKKEVMYLNLRVELTRPWRVEKPNGAQVIDH